MTKVFHIENYWFNDNSATYLHFQDWNDFLSNFKKVQFCIVNDNTINQTSDDNHISHQNYKDVVSKVHEKFPGADTKETTISTSVAEHRV